jgi:hypothetical protein
MGLVNEYIINVLRTRLLGTVARFAVILKRRKRLYVKEIKYE